MTDPAAAWAYRLRAAYDLDGPATRADFRRIVEDRGAGFFVSDRINPGESCFGVLETGEAAVLVAERAGAFECGHETGHAVLHDAAAHGADLSDLDGDPESVCDRIGAVLAGPEPEPAPSYALQGWELPEFVDVPIRAWNPAPPPEFVPDEPGPVGYPSTHPTTHFRVVYLWLDPRRRSPFACREVFCGTCRRPR